MSKRISILASNEVLQKAEKNQTIGLFILNMPYWKQSLLYLPRK